MIIADNLKNDISKAEEALGKLKDSL